MTIGSIAQELGVSTMTVYRRIKRAGLDVASLRDSDTGEITSEGLAVIGGLFTTTRATTDTTTRPQHAQHEDVPGAEILRVKLEAAEAMLKSVTDERDRLRTQVDALTEMLRAEQLQRQALLPATHGGGLFGWFRRIGRKSDG